MIEQDQFAGPLFVTCGQSAEIDAAGRPSTILHASIPNGRVTSAVLVAIHERPHEASELVIDD
jgi:hypothetical protein